MSCARWSLARCVRRAVWLCIAALSAGLLLATPAETKQLRIKRFDAEVLVREDGTIGVTETIQAQFIGGPWRGLYRTIPIEYRTPQGLNYTLFLDVERVTDEDGHPLKYESSRERHYRKLKIYVPHADNSKQTIVLRYRVSDALRFFEDHDELYWNVTGDEWDVPIEDATARVVLPGNTTGIRATSFTGAYGSRANDAETEITGNSVEVRMRKPLGFHEGLTIGIAWDKGVVHEPSKLERFVLLLRSNSPLFLPFIAFGVMAWLWYTRGRDPRLRPIAAQYQPPDGLTPAEVGTLVDDSVDMRDIISTIVDLAVRGFLLIEEQKKEHLMGLWSDKEYVFHLRKPVAEWSGLKEHEKRLLEGMFDGGAADRVELSDLQNQFYKNLPGIRNGIFESLMRHGYYRRRPDKVRQGYIGGGIVTGILIAFAGPWASAHFGVQPLPFFIAGALTAGVILIFGWFMPARTMDGARALEGALGFEDFLDHVEADRFERMIKTPEMFEKFLPFAMALGVEKNWVKAFQNICTQPPEWYRGGYGPTFYPMGFVNDLHSMTTRASTVLASAPRSSGGSAFGGGGGGSSGGGFGGGGGGGF
jgi:uncharacterized membrane protein YgcG